MPKSSYFVWARWSILGKKVSLELRGDRPDSATLKKIPPGDGDEGSLILTTFAAFGYRLFVLAFAILMQSSFGRVTP